MPMQLRQFEKRKESKAVWMNADELEALLDQTADEHQRLALGLMARSGMRVSEAIVVEGEDMIKTEAGHMARIWAGKGDKYRETPVSQESWWLASALDTGAGPLVGAAKRTVQGWVERAAESMYRKTDDEGWRYVSAHDLRRSWATLLIQNDVEPLLVLDWGGWSDYKTFRDHYMSINSPEYQAEERTKIEWL
jgi:integrase